MIKATVKNVVIALSILAMVMVVLVAIDKSSAVTTSSSNTKIKVFVQDLDGNPLHNANVTICGKTYFTDDKGYSPSIELCDLSNCYDSDVSSWFTVNVVITKDGYVPTALFNCVVYQAQTRRLTVNVYKQDGSELPFVCYVEAPPEDYVKDVIKQK